MKQQAVVRWIVMALLCGTRTCLAVDPLDARAAQLALALSVPTNATAHTPCSHVFADKEAVRVGAFQVGRKRIVASLPEKPMDIDVRDTNGQVVAAGRLVECASFEAARTALLKRLVLNSMGIEMVAQMHEVRSGEIGELCIVQKAFDTAGGKYTSHPAAIHFVRGCTGVSLYSVTGGEEIWAAAKALDAALSEVPIEEKSSAGNWGTH